MLWIVLSNDFRSLFMYGGLEWTWSNEVGTIKFWKSKGKVKSIEILVVFISFV